MYSFHFKLEKGDRNAGTVYLPDKESLHLPVIIFCHGWGGVKGINPSTKAVLESAVKANVAFVTFDNFGRGETGGDFSEMTYGRWAKCTEDIFDWVSKEDFSNGHKIGCFSISSGTTAAIRFAQRTQKPAFIISVGTAITSHIRMGCGGPCKVMTENLDTLLNGGKVAFSGVEFPLAFYLDELQNLAIYSMDKIRCPVFFLQGLKDNPWRITDAKLGYAQMLYHQLPCKHFEVEGGDHELNNKANICVHKSMEWLEEIGMI